HAAADEPGVGVAGPVGRRGDRGLPLRLRRLAGRQPRRAIRRHVRVHRLLLRAAGRPLALSRRAAGDPAASAPERRTAAVHVLHDFRSQDHARLARRARAVRRARRRRRVVRAVPPVQNQRAALVARRLLAARPADRSAAARRPLRVDNLATGVAAGAHAAGRIAISHQPSAISHQPSGIWNVERGMRVFSKEPLMKRTLFAVTLASMIAWSSQALLGFCGFYVSKADTSLFNKASQVVLVRDGDRTVMTMANDFQGEAKEFAVVIPVPTFLKREQIHVGDKALVDHLDAYSAPRLVEYFDANPCERREMLPMASAAPVPMPAMRDAVANRARSLGVTIEASYTVGEYDILILSAEQSAGLETWLRENGYRIPAGASEVIGSYLKQNMRFFVAKVNVAEQSRLGFTYLRPLQVAYESPKFMLPIRLGMVNAKGTQDLFVYALTRNGRVETTNYRTTKLPADMELPVFLKQPNEFAGFYKAMFARQVNAQGGKAVF